MAVLSHSRTEWDENFFLFFFSSQSFKLGVSWFVCCWLISVLESFTVFFFSLLISNPPERYSTAKAGDKMRLRVFCFCPLRKVQSPLFCSLLVYLFFFTLSFCLVFDFYRIAVMPWLTSFSATAKLWFAGVENKRQNIQRAPKTSINPPNVLKKKKTQNPDHPVKTKTKKTKKRNVQKKFKNNKIK